MYKTTTHTHGVLRFKRFSRKGYALFACLGRQVLVGVLSAATLAHAKADGVSTKPMPSDTTALHHEVTLHEVDVTGSRVPMTALQGAKIVSVITRDDIHRAAAESINDILKLATGVDVRQRGAFGVQTDISINGGTFDQITILLNGVNISSPQTGHNAADFPVALSDIDHIEVLEGAAARIYGSSAFSGAINIVTRPYAASAVKANAEGGSFGTFEATAGVTLATGTVAQLASGGYTQSDGGTFNSDFKRGRAFYQGRLSAPAININWQAGFSTQNYGANTFYSAKFPNQYEETRRIIASIGGDIKGLPSQLTLSPLVYWHRDYDHFQLTRGQQGAKAGENYHRTDVYGASLNAYISWVLGKTAIGADVRREELLSTAYGNLLGNDRWTTIHGTTRQYDHRGRRTNTGFFAEHNILLDKITLSAGVLANKNTAIDGYFRFYPGVDVAFRPSSRWKLSASWNMALRVPTYTDLYTNSGAQVGDLNLKPERNTTYKLAARYRYTGVEVVANAFYSHGKDMIDWVYATKESSRYQAMNIGRLNNIGASADATLYLPELTGNDRFFLRHIKVGYAYIHQNHETNRPIFKSLYALEYLRHKFVAQIHHRIWSRLSASWAVRWQQRMNGYHPYAKVDGKLMWQAPSYTLYVKADNITAHRYYDIGGVRQPGLWLMAGGSINIKF